MMKYGFEDYNEYNILKIPLSLVLVDLYLLKHFVFFVLPIISSIPFLVKFAHEQFHIALLFSGIPALLVFVSMLRRVPKTRSFMLRWLWQKGRLLLLLSLVLELGLLSLFIVLGMNALNEASLMFLYLDVVFIFFMVKSQRVRDVFAEFPKYEQKQL